MFCFMPLFAVLDTYTYIVYSCWKVIDYHPVVNSVSDLGLRYLIQHYIKIVYCLLAGSFMYNRLGIFRRWRTLH